MPTNKTPVAPAPRPTPANPHVQATGRPPRRRTGLYVLIVVVLLIGGIWWVNHREQARGPVDFRRREAAAKGRGHPGGFAAFGPNAPLPVGVAAVVKGDIPVYLNALGTITAAQTATIRSQISGQLQQIAFQEGQYVHAGDLLAVIDPRPYQNALDQAKAQLQQAQAQLATAQDDLKRYHTLAQQDSIAQQQVDTARHQVTQDQGLVQVAQVAIATANLNLTYCHIRAPFDGRVGLRQVDVGNYVTPGDSNGIVVLTETKPITAIFTLPEDNMGEVAARLHSGARLPVDAYDRTDSHKIATGVLSTMDNVIDPTTGTFRLRALFSNEDESLFPNQFVNIRLLLKTVHDATVIPTSAVERGQQGPYVYVVTPQRTAMARNVTLGVSQGERVAVTSGLKLGDIVVIDGADRLKDGRPVILNQPGQPVPAGLAPAGRRPPGGARKGTAWRRSKRGAAKGAGR